MGQIKVSASCTSAVTPSLFSGWGSVAFASPSAITSEETYLCSVSGRDANGREVIALLDEPAPPTDAVASPREALTFAKPRRMSHSAAAQLPLLALTAAAALHAVGLPPGRASIGSDSPVPAHILIAGSSGRLPALLVQVLAARGARVCVAAQDEATRKLLQLGAAEVIDHNRQSFLTVLGERKTRPLDAVLDCLGAEQAEARRELKEQTGAAYVSLAPPELTTLQERGAFDVLASRWKLWRGSEQNSGGAGGAIAAGGGRVWTADETAAEALSEVLRLIEDGSVEPPAEANTNAELVQQYLEYVNWARDAENGLRWGFPGDAYPQPEAYRDARFDDVEEA